MVLNLTTGLPCGQELVLQQNPLVQELAQEHCRTPGFPCLNYTRCKCIWEGETSAKPAFCRDSFHNPTSGFGFLAGWFAFRSKWRGGICRCLYTALLVSNHLCSCLWVLSAMAGGGKQRPWGDQGWCPVWCSASLEAVIHRWCLPAHPLFPAKEKGSGVCRCPEPHLSSLSTSHHPHLTEWSHIYSLRDTSSSHSTQ